MRKTEMNEEERRKIKIKTKNDVEERRTENNKKFFLLKEQRMIKDKENEIDQGCKRRTRNKFKKNRSNKNFKNAV